jgi:hypothetical protein
MLVAVSVFCLASRKALGTTSQPPDLIPSPPPVLCARACADAGQATPATVVPGVPGRHRWGSGAAGAGLPGRQGHVGGRGEWRCGGRAGPESCGAGAGSRCCSGHSVEPAHVRSGFRVRCPTTGGRADPRICHSCMLLRPPGAGCSPGRRSCREGKGAAECCAIRAPLVLAEANAHLEAVPYLDLANEDCARVGRRSAMLYFTCPVLCFAAQHGTARTGSAAGGNSHDIIMSPPVFFFSFWAGAFLFLPKE